MKIKGFIIFGLVLCIAGGIVCGVCGANGGFDFTKTDIFAKVDDSNVTYTENNYSVEGISKIDIDTYADRVSIVGEDRSDIYVKNKELDNLTYEITVENNTLNITQKSGITFNWRSYAAFYSKSLEIKVPSTLVVNYDIEINAGTLSISDVKMNSLNLEDNAGTIDFNNVTADRMDIDMNAGTVVIKNAEVNTLNIEMDAGTLNYHGNSNDVRMEMDAGYAEYKGQVTHRGNFSIDAGSLSVKFTDSSSNYSVNGKGDGTVIIAIDKDAGWFDYSFDN